MPPLTWGEGGSGNIWHGTKSCASEIPLPQSADPLVALRVDYQSRHSNTAMEIASKLQLGAPAFCGLVDRKIV